MLHETGHPHNCRAEANPMVRDDVGAPELLTAVGRRYEQLHDLRHIGQLVIQSTCHLYNYCGHQNVK